VGVQFCLYDGFVFFFFFFAWSMEEVCDGISNGCWWGQSDSDAAISRQR